MPRRPFNLAAGIIAAAAAAIVLAWPAGATLAITATPPNGATPANGAAPATGATPARGGDAPARSAAVEPATTPRLLKTFDFEEREAGNREDLPMFWHKVEGAGLPHYVNGRLTIDAAHAGRYAFRLDLDGGSVIYRYDAGRLKVRPGAHYRVTAFVRTTALQHARLRLGATFADSSGRPIPGTTRRSEPFASNAADAGNAGNGRAAGDGGGAGNGANGAGADWQAVGFDLSADQGDAASMILEIALLQPELLGAPARGGRPTEGPPARRSRPGAFRQDIRGTAWIDDITVAQVPQIAFTTDRPGNIFRRSQPTLLRLRLDDTVTDDLSADLIVTRADGTPVYQRSGTIDFAPTASPASPAPPLRPAPTETAPTETASTDAVPTDARPSALAMSSQSPASAPPDASPSPVAPIANPGGHRPGHPRPAAGLVSGHRSGRQWPQSGRPADDPLHPPARRRPARGP